ncbi:conserved hypothetical protein [Talaromyces stipitatus ATCC 10500]|uniref:DUF1365 domain protein n=1 Tax=Talaromyces stipitatus (strain ATCC 10500 / CBS 375.48 / QM 6759 / NRRL 1006) TaxID=441959 RepID=B8M0S0_TALSN|nr:uncharacterized protein TSTA_086860 [Talaromyces stipitatus ATCC 10500]EED21453.1 conserved hypothetical protein [Talaromyces stipitatus ATCC 10500]
MVLETTFDCLPSWVGQVAFGTTLVSLVLWLSSFFSAFKKYDRKTMTEDVENDSSLLGIDEVLVFPGRTSHTRLSPVVRSFWFHFLIAAVPIRNCRSNWFVSVDSDTKPWWHRGWLRVDPPDHLHRGEDENGLSYKLDKFLSSKQYNPADYPTVWLVTSPRFLGYKSDQASFWYLYTADGTLDMMIIEANNSFDERKVWVVPAAQEHGMCNNTATKTHRRKFHQYWPKEFHVSPFNSIHGSYSISTLDSFSPGKPLNSANAIDLTITLLESQRRPKLVARVWSVSKPLIPSRVWVLYGYLFLASWCLTAALVTPRTLFQAFILSKKHKLSFRVRPEPKPGTFPRRNTTAEGYLREIFIDYLRQIMNKSPENFYLTLSEPGFETIILNTRNVAWDSPLYHISVLTPKFYATIVTCPTIETFLYTALLHKDDGRRTACTDTKDSEGLIVLLKYVAAYFSLSSRDPNSVLWNTTDTASNGNTITRTWIVKSPKLAILSLLSLIWFLVTHVRYWLSKSSGEGLRLSNTVTAPTSVTESGTKVQIDEELCSHADTYRNGTVTDDSKCFLDHFVRENYGPAAQFGYLWAQLNTVMREQILGITGGG